MNLTFLATAGLLTGCLCAQNAHDSDLAKSLANPSTRQSAVDRIAACGDCYTALLLSWTRTPPAGVDPDELNLGLAQAFGELRTKQAIPFLIANISIHSWHHPNIWLKAPEVVRYRLPAAAALIRIGPDASQALVRVSSGPMTSEDRLATVFVISMIAAGTNDRQAHAFLQISLGEANLQRQWAQRGLDMMEHR